MSKKSSPWVASLRDLDAWLFVRPIPVDGLCLYRLGFGLLLFLQAATWLPHTRELFSNQGFHTPLLPLPAPSPSLALASCLVLMLASASLCVGLFTRVATAAALVPWTFLYLQDQIAEEAITSIVLVLLVLLLFAPCGAKYSVDAWLRTRRGQPLQKTTSPLALRLLQLEFAQVYFFCGMTKMAHPQWVDGSVFFHIFTSRYATDLGIWISGRLPALTAHVGAFATILYELLAGFLLFQPLWRPWVITVGVLFHLGIQSVLAVGFLGPHFGLALVTLFPSPPTLKRIVRALRRLQPRSRSTA